MFLSPGEENKQSSQLTFSPKWPILLLQSLLIASLPNKWGPLGLRGAGVAGASFATDGYVSRVMSLPVPENPDYSDQLYSFNSFNPDTYITDSETWCRSNLPTLPKVSRLMCETFPRSTVLMAFQGTRAGVQNCKQAFAVSY